MTDIDDGSKADIDLPSPTKAGVVDIPKGGEGKSLETGLTQEEEDAATAKRVGWVSRFGWPKDPEDTEDLLDHATWLESQISETYFGGKRRCNK